jgi:hypothetical protein
LWLNQLRNDYIHSALAQRNFAMPMIVTPFRALLPLALATSSWSCVAAPDDASAPRQVASTQNPLADNIVFDDEHSACDDDQRQVLRDQTDAAYQLAVDAYDAFFDNPGSERTQRWFGSFDVNGFYRIASILANTVTTLKSNELIYQCTSFPNCEYAQTIEPGVSAPDPNDANHYDHPLMKFRPLFFADVPDKYTQVENVYHEATHVAGSSDESDICSGYQNAFNLAQTDPTSASYCAYNFQYFAMDAGVGPDPRGCL